MLARDGFRADRQTGTTSGTGRLLECVKCTRQTGVFLEYRADRSSGLAASEGCTPFGGSLRRYWTWAWGSVSVPTSPADDNRLPAPVLAHDPVSTGPAPNGTAQPAARRLGNASGGVGPRHTFVAAALVPRVGMRELRRCLLGSRPDILAPGDPAPLSAISRMILSPSLIQIAEPRSPLVPARPWQCLGIR
jgi:hypothetical protein